MKNMTAQNIAKACSGVFANEAEISDKPISSVVIDSRKCSENCLFIAMRGENVDSHKFIPDCVKAGASLIVAEYKVDCDVPLILVDNALKALEDIAYLYRQQLDLKVVGITGSVGKTSTKEAIAAVLSEKYNVLKTEANLNNNIGLPLMVLSIRQEHTAAVLELGISHFGEMVRMSRVARPDIAVITNIGESHIENLGSRKGILEEKGHIFDFLPEDGVAVVNGDDDMLREFSLEGHKVCRFGEKSDTLDARATNIELKQLEGSSFDIELPGGEIRDAFTAVPGIHSVHNAVCAALIGRLMGMDDKEILLGISHINTLSGRTNVVKTDRYTIIDDCYNASPSSMKAALKLLASSDGRKVAILGDMFELGADEVKLHSETGAYAAGEAIDLIITVGELSHNMFKAIEASERFKNGSLKASYFNSVDELLGELPDMLENGDNVLVKASHGMNFSRIVKVLEDKENT